MYDSEGFLMRVQEPITNPKFASKQALRKAIANGKVVSVARPGLDGGFIRTGIETVIGLTTSERRWSAQVEVREGRIVKVVS